METILWVIIILFAIVNIIQNEQIRRLENRMDKLKNEVIREVEYRDFDRKFRESMDKLTKTMRSNR